MASHSDYSKKGKLPEGAKIFNFFAKTKTHKFSLRKLGAPKTNLLNAANLLPHYSRGNSTQSGVLAAVLQSPHHRVSAVGLQAAPPWACLCFASHCGVLGAGGSRSGWGHSGSSRSW